MLPGLPGLNTGENTFKTTKKKKKKLQSGGTY